MPEETPGQVNLQEDKTNLQVDDKKVDDKKDDKKDEPTKGSERWNDIYYKAKEGERRVAELEKDLSSMRKHNEDLSEVLKVSIVKDEDKQPNIQDTLKQLKESRSKAAKDLEWDKVYELDDKIDDIKDFIRTSNKPKPDNIDDKIADTVTYNQEKQIISDFVANHMPWMNKLDANFDETMSDAAIGLDNRLIPGWKGSVNERMREVKSRIEKRFNFNPSKGLPNVQDAGNGSNNKEVVKIDLTDNEKRVAHKLFPEDKDAEKRYHQQKVLIANRRNAK